MSLFVCLFWVKEQKVREREREREKEKINGKKNGNQKKAKVQPSSLPSLCERSETPGTLDRHVHLGSQETPVLSCGFGLHKVVVPLA